MHGRSRLLGLAWLSRLLRLPGLLLLLWLLLLGLTRYYHSHLLLLHWIVLEPLLLLLLLRLLLPLLLLASHHVGPLLNHRGIAHLLLRRHHHLRVALAAEALNWHLLLLVGLSLGFLLDLLNGRKNTGCWLRPGLSGVVHHSGVHGLLSGLHLHRMMLRLLLHGLAHHRLLRWLLRLRWLLLWWLLLLWRLRSRGVADVLLRDAFRHGAAGVHPRRVHLRHSPPHHGRVLQPLLHLLLAQLLLDVLAEGHRTLGLLAHLGVVAAQRDELLADGTTAVGLSLALLGVGHDSLHLVTRRRPAVGVSALARVD